MQLYFRKKLHKQETKSKSQKYELIRVGAGVREKEIGQKKQMYIVHLPTVPQGFVQMGFRYEPHGRHLSIPF